MSGPRGVGGRLRLVAIIPGRTLPREAMPKAKAAALKALEIDDSLAEALCVISIGLAPLRMGLEGCEEKLQAGDSPQPKQRAAPSMVRLVAQDSGAPRRGSRGTQGG